MRVFVAGGTGTLGRPTVRLLVAAGHEVRALARTPERGAILRGLGAEPVVADLFDLQAMTAAVAGSEAVLHLATRIPPPARMRNLAAWRDNDRLRSQGSSILVSAALAADAKVYVQESITFLYQDLGDQQIFETAPIDAPQPLASARDAERETSRFTARRGQGIVLRFGGFYAAEAPSTLAVVALARRRLFPIIGTGDHYVSSIHVDDAAAATVAALAVPAGIYNVVDDEPLRMRDWMGALTDAFGFKPARRLPLPLARLLLGRPVDLLSRSQRVNNTMFKAVAAWTPRHPSVRQGWRAVADALKAAKTA
ncbi:MAG: NAD(P)H-binding protein [Deltaproteobacteria bacterium]|nr:NAD(P)H-binding protein [Deltaproteobacteria bacterium]